MKDAKKVDRKTMSGISMQGVKPRPTKPAIDEASQVTLKKGAEADLLHGRDIICFAQDWTGDPLSKTHLMRILARDNRILWVNSIGLRSPTASKADFRRIVTKLRAATLPIKEVEPNLFVLSLFVIPAYDQPILRSLNQGLIRFQVMRAIQRLKFKNFINYVFIPSAGVIAGTLGEDTLIYHCVDEYSAFSGVPSESLARIEESLLRRADLVLVSADLLYQSKIRFNSRMAIVRHGVDHAHFSKALDSRTLLPKDIEHLPKPTIGFFGLIADWVDLDLLGNVARHFHGGSLIILGKSTTDTSILERIPNVHLLGRKNYADLPAYCKGFDVALMPFRINELTLNANPLKVREYLAAGLPVVSTAIPEVELLGQCRIGRTREHFIEEIGLALEHPGPQVSISESVKVESWEARVDEVRRAMVNFIAHKP